MNSSFHSKPHNLHSFLCWNLKNALGEIFEDRTVCALQAKLETQISSSLLGCASNVSHSTGEIYLPASVSQLGHKLSLITLWLLTHQCCFFYFILPFFLRALMLCLAGKAINGSTACNAVIKSSLPGVGRGSILISPCPDILFPHLVLECWVSCLAQWVGHGHVCGFWKCCQRRCHMLLLNIAFLWVWKIKTTTFSQSPNCSSFCQINESFWDFAALFLCHNIIPK